MTQNSYRSPLLVGMKSIIDRFELNRELFYVLLNLHMPVVKINGRWYGHERNIDEFLRTLTVKQRIVTVEQKYDPDTDDFQPEELNGFSALKKH